MRKARPEQAQVTNVQIVSIFIPHPLRMPDADNGADLTDIMTLLPLDASILGWYNMPVNQAEYLINFFQFQFSYGNSFIRNALLTLTYALINQMNEQLAMGSEIRELKEQNKQLLVSYRELEQANESLEADARALPGIQVRRRWIVRIGPATHHLRPPQNKLEETRQNYERYIDEVRTIQADAQQLDELKEVNLLLRAQIAKANQQAVKTERDLKRAEAKLKKGVDLLNETALSSAFPVLQNNGLIMDFGRVISRWVSAAEDDEGVATREFVCASTQKTTTLARFPMTDRIQQIACALGLKIEPPLLFERKKDDAWIPLSSKEHIELTATVCYLYANRERITTANTLLGEDVISFKLSKVNPFHVPLPSYCRH
jgi:hypothetical protein